MLPCQSVGSYNPACVVCYSPLFIFIINYTLDSVLLSWSDSSLLCLSLQYNILHSSYVQFIRPRPSETRVQSITSYPAPLNSRFITEPVHNASLSSWLPRSTRGDIKLRSREGKTNQYTPRYHTFQCCLHCSVTQIRNEDASYQLLKEEIKLQRRRP